ncbi:hypothetical protein UFOVP1022_31 [uncultured Caudovirales phage]|uniref:Uncharacterized protein n=1 Tax=uncultured Caudovirales phage TaxID=2100421 RepID=A0A6J5QQM1_9CAUD|nr:hypothetical protein UFOVP1022_31 [uncultured Caudovirales phage]CAB4183791.1 hypothetical protein UFOVP1110_10 [uncultured Caudovirales phage]CAB4202370.1 hypothetical protein UFOVP1378_12 [uncultured Caudovirales phage]CAB4215359.1 hypothetical protein UFOVP1474_17 [uncultured Caudovirales phage]CAB5230292.1 hypothetical protein UFOVP1561_53 [uncultured Caudovirales phage]
MAYDEYNIFPTQEEPPKDIPIRDVLRNIVSGFENKKNYQDIGEAATRVRDIIPNVTESLGRGGFAQAGGVYGDIRDLRNTINSYQPKSLRNVTQIAEFLSNPYLTSIVQGAPTTEKILKDVPRKTDPYEGYKQHETLGEFIAPGLGYLGRKALKGMKDLKLGLSIEDVSKTAPIVKDAEKLTSDIDQLGFHSSLENAILGIKQPKGTGDQLLNQLEKTPGVKTEELDLTGVKQYLQENPNVTKEDLLSYIENNRLKLEQKVLSESTVGDIDEYRLNGGDVYHDDDYIRSMADDIHYEMKADDVLRNEEKARLLESDPERYADYENNPYSDARLQQDIDSNLYEKVLDKSHEQYYDNPIRHYYDELGYDVYGNHDLGYSFKDPNGNHLHIGNAQNATYDINDAEQALREYHLEHGNLDHGGDGVKYEDYTLPGKYENYREVLTTLPSRENSTYIYASNADDKVIKKFPNYQEAFDYAQSRPQEERLANHIKPLNNARDFESSHFDEPNILAHTRVNDRIINGKKTLMVEEIQSDWHQAGRKKGYDTPEVRQRIFEERQKLMDQKKHFEELAKPYTDLGKDAPPEIVDGWTQAANGMQELQKIENGMRNSVPNAPFKKNWHEQQVKQILDMAAKGDYDAIAFTTGKQQAERYNLSKQVDKINWMPYESNGSTKVVRIQPINGNTIELRLSPEGAVMNGGQFADKTIDEVIGKDIAKKIMDSNTGDLSGVNLDIGGEGMKGFYDKMIPEYINKYAKKWGMGMKKANLNHPTGIFKEEEVKQMFKENNITKEEFNKLPASEKNKMWKSIDKGEEVHFVDLSDMAKKEIKEKGQPLFAGIGALSGAEFMDGLDEQNKTGILKELMKTKK